MLYVILALLVLPSSAFVPYCKYRSEISLLGRRKTRGDDSPRGFKPVVQLPDLNVTATTINASLIGMDLVPSTEPESPELVDAESVFKKYQISEGQNLPKSKKITKKEYNENAPFGQETIANMSFEMQGKVESALLTSVFATLAFVILCGKKYYFHFTKVISIN